MRVWAGRPLPGPWGGQWSFRGVTPRSCQAELGDAGWLLLQRLALALPRSLTNWKKVFPARAVRTVKIGGSQRRVPLPHPLKRVPLGAFQVLEPQFLCEHLRSLSLSDTHVLRRLLKLFPS